MMSGRKKDVALSVVLPVHNEAPIIKKVVTGFYREIISRFKDSELIVAEDGSTDGTKEILLALSKKLPKMTLVLGEKKKGYMMAARDALLISRGRLILFSDSDGQHDPRDFWRLHPAMARDKSVGIVNGARLERRDSLHRRILSFVHNLMVSVLFGLPRFDFNSGFKLMRRDVVNEVVGIRHLKCGFSTELLVRAANAGFGIVEVQVNHRKRGNFQGRGAQFAPLKLPGAIKSELLGLLELKRELLFSERNSRRR